MATMRIEETLQVLRFRIREAASRNELRLPPEVDLAAELGVGRSTLREALALLEAEGVVRRVRSQGTFIRPSAVRRTEGVLTYPVDLILSFADYLTAHGVRFTIEQFFFGRDASSELEQGTGPDGGVVDVYRTWQVFRVDGTPAAYLEHVVPVTFGDHAVQPSMLVEGVTALFDHIPGVRLESIDNTITAESALERMAGILDVPVGTALVVMNARMFDTDSRPIGVGRLVFRPDVLALSVRAVSRVNVKRH